MSNPGQHAASDGTWRPADLIAGFAYAKATILEQDSERIGIIYVLTEILTALHRQAETLEAVNKNISGFRNELPTRLTGK